MSVVNKSEVVSQAIQLMTEAAQTLCQVDLCLLQCCHASIRYADGEVEDDKLRELIKVWFDVCAEIHSIEFSYNRFMEEQSYGK